MHSYNYWYIFPFPFLSQKNTFRSALHREVGGSRLIFFLIKDGLKGFIMKGPQIKSLGRRVGRGWTMELKIVANSKGVNNLLSPPLGPWQKSSVLEEYYFLALMKEEMYIYSSDLTPFLKFSSANMHCTKIMFFLIIKYASWVSLKLLT